MKKYIIGNATVRIHGSYDPEKVKEAATAFLKKAEIQRKKGKENDLSGVGVGNYHHWRYCGSDLCRADYHRGASVQNSAKKNHEEDL